jgi:hypothetical protein
MRCVYEERRGMYIDAFAGEQPFYRPCGRPGVGMFEQKPYCDEHMKEVEEHYWAQHRNDQASQAD